MKKVLSFILSAAVAVGSVSVPVLAQADEENRDYIIDHDYSDAAYDTTEEVFATGRYYVGGIGDGKDTGAAEDDNISAAVEDGRLVLTAKSAAENTIDFDLRKDGQPLTGKVYIEYKVEIMDGTKETRLEPRNSGSTLYSMAFGPNSGVMTPWAATGQSAPTPEGNPTTEWGAWRSDLVSDSYVIKSTINTETQEIEKLTCNGTDIIPNGAKYFRQYADGVDRIRLYRASGGAADAGICALEYIKVWQDEISSEDAQADLDAITEDVILNGQSADHVTGALNLIKTGSVNGTSITWTASPEGIINTDTGAVTRPAEDTQVTLTAEAAGLSKQFTVTVKAQDPGQIEYIINHDYSEADYDTVEEVFGTGKYWIAGIGSGVSSEYSNDNIEFRVENGELIAHVKNTAGISHLEVDLRDEDGNPQTGKVWVEYKINLKSPKKTLVEPRSGSSIISTTYYQGTNWSSVSMATSNTDPEIGSATNWGGELADGSNSYIMRALYNTDTRTIDEFYCNDADADNSIGDYFRQNAQGIDRLRFYDNADAQFAAEADVYGIEYIRAWKEIETQDVIDQQRADEDAEAINNAVVLGTQLPNSVSADINLVSEGPVNGSAVTWTTAPEGIVDPLTGAVSVVEEATDVTLTATVNYNGKIATKVLNITVVPPGATSQYVFEEDFEYATVDEMFSEGSRLSPSSSPFSMLALSMQNGTEVKFRQATTPKTSEAIFIDFSDYAHRLNGEHYVEIKVKKDNPRANWQLKLYPETVAVNREFVTMDVSNGNLSWRLSSGWTGAPYIPITDTNYVTVRMLLDFTNQTISEIYVDDGEDGSAVDGIQTEIIDSSDGRTVPFMNGATAIGGVAIWANNNMADGSSFDVDYVRIWDSEKSLVRADIDALTLADITAENPGEITQNVTLPAAGKVNGTEFTWTSSNEDAIALDGTVTRPQNGDAAVILTASAEADGETFEKSFYLNVSGITGGGIDDSEFDYDVYNNAFTEIGSEIDISSSANAEITDERLSVKPVDQTSSASAEINFTNEDGSFGLTGRAVVEFDASAAGGSGSYEIRSTDGSSMASVAVTDSDYTITTRDNTLTVPYRANDNLKLRFVFDTDNDTVQVWHNNIEITGETLRPITSGKNISSLNMTVSGGTEACATIDNLRVGIADSSRLQMVYDAFIFDLIKGDNASETEVRYDLNLFTEYILDSEISWTSGDTSIINPETGEVIRPQDSDKQVSLTAQIGLNDSDETRTKTFELTVKKYNASNLAQEKDVRVSVSAADGTSAANITDGSYDTAFRTIGSERSFNVTIDLGSAQQISGAAIYEGMVDGQYSITEYDIMVSDDQNTWTTVYDEGTTIGEERNIDFKPVTARYVRLAVTGKELGRAAEIREIEVVFDPTDRNRVDADTDALVLDSDYTVTEDITLPAQGEYGSEIEWRSSHEDIISADGEFTRPSTDTIVTLTATIKSGNITKEKTFTKLAKGRNAGNGGNNGGGSGGTGSSSGGSSGLPYIPQATPAPVPTDDPGTSTETFTDLETVPWAEEYIYELAERGIVYGVGDGKFDPDRGITREEAVKMIVKAFNIEAEGSADNFNDVSSSDWYSEFVRAAYAAGVVKGISDDTFGVGTKITREDFAVMITRALEYSGYEIAGNTDNSRLDGVSDYAKEAMAMMFDNGIMTGDESGNLNPKAETSRAQSAKIICMAMELQ